MLYKNLEILYKKVKGLFFDWNKTCSSQVTTRQCSCIPSIEVAKEENEFRDRVHMMLPDTNILDKA